MPHASPQRSRASRSACRASWSARLCTGRYMRQSSANNLTWEVTTLGRSFMWIKNSKGPRTVPWGTPDKTLAGLEYFPSTSTDCDLVFKKEAVHFHRGPCMPQNSIFPNKWSCGMVSKALEKSKIAMSTWILRSRKVKRSWRVSNSCVSQDHFYLNQWLKGVRILCLSKWVRKCLTMMCSKILHDTQVRETGL